MIRSEQLAISVLALCLVACAKESRETGGLVRHTITAGISTETKAELKADDATRVLWSAGESVDVWVGESAYTFTGQNASAVASTTFSGTAPADLGTWVLVSPQSAGTGKSGNVITATLPAVQTAVAGGFDRNAALIAGLGSGATVTCKHLYSGIRFKLTESDIKSVSLRGNNGEKIAGEFTFDISASSPVITGGTSETIVLNAPDGGTFSTGVWYYILCLPVTFSNGVTITAYNGSRAGYVTTDTPTSFTRAQLKSRENLTFTEWRTVYYGPANTTCLTKKGETIIDVTPRLVTAGWKRSGIAVTADRPDGYEILWGGSSIASVSLSLDGTNLSITASDTPGCALVAIKKGSTILWSYLIWVVKSDISETTLPNGSKLLPPLGDNCYFQWGRKDPLLSNASQLENVYHGLDSAIKYPSKFIKGVASTYDWFCGARSGDQDATLWGGESGPKTVWDPCPQGYRVPSEADYTHDDIDFTYIKDPENGFLNLGILSRNNQSSEESSEVVFNSSNCSYWTRQVYNEYGCALDDNDYDDPFSIFYGFNREQALPIRCIKE